MSTRDWRERAACKGMDVELFFGAGSHNSPVAERVCRGCPVRVDCLDYAIDDPRLFGMWGGVSAVVRRALRAGRARRTCPACRSKLVVNVRSERVQGCRACGLSWRVLRPSEDAHRATTAA